MYEPCLPLPPSPVSFTCPGEMGRPAAPPPKVLCHFWPHLPMKSPLQRQQSLLKGGSLSPFIPIQLMVAASLIKGDLSVTQNHLTFHRLLTPDLHICLFFYLYTTFRLDVDPKWRNTSFFPLYSHNIPPVRYVRQRDCDMPSITWQASMAE